ncbi:ATP-binding protein, partial [Candidatus Riflebacteria bacterium]
LAGGVAHDLNNILGPMILLPAYLEDFIRNQCEGADKDRDEAIDSARIIKTSALRVKSVIKDLMTLGRRGKYDMGCLDINEMFQVWMDSNEYKFLKGVRSGVSVLHEFCSGELAVTGSVSHLTRIVMNLVQNAVEAIVDKGKVMIKTSKINLQQEEYGYEIIPAGDYAVIQITDTGQGIKARDLKHIFEPFFTGKVPGEKSGSGLGLSVVHSLVKDHSGFIDVESKAGFGSTFRIYFPLFHGGKRKEKKQQKLIATGGDERILIVDDEPSMLQSMNTILKRLGYRITMALDGSGALKYFEEAKQAGEVEPFDLVVLDIIMKEMGGVETYKEIMKLYPQQKILFISGFTPTETTSVLQDMGTDWLKKPFEADEFSKVVREKLNGKD